MDNIADQLTALLNVAIAGLLAAVPGLERELRDRPAGLRTHMLVGMSAAMIASVAHMLLAEDPAARVVANVITGVGFLGAGAIIQRDSTVKDLTTAASIWMVALMGLVVAYEQYVLAGGATLILAVVLTVLRKFEEHILKTRGKHDHQEIDNSDADGVDSNTT